MYVLIEYFDKVCPLPKKYKNVEMIIDAVVNACATKLQLKILRFEVR